MTAHDDSAPGDFKVAAHILNLTKDWQRTYGGLLIFCNNWGQPSDVRVPSFNTLALFKVPQMHYVSEVAADAGSSRLALYGWVVREPVPAILT